MPELMKRKGEQGWGKSTWISSWPELADKRPVLVSWRPSGRAPECQLPLLKSRTRPKSNFAGWTTGTDIRATGASL